MYGRGGGRGGGARPWNERHREHPQHQLPDNSTVESHGRDAWRDYAAVRHPDDAFDKTSGAGLGRRILFQRVPEGKSAKNRLHLDLHVGENNREAEVARLEGLGARVLYQADEPVGVWTTMADPEGNEFCVE
ncbi:VOC family protein [Streptomyces lunaelactis]|uniref:VOC family protein n=1 Tax=Streptomyces lunaelactis TaxID=1535768 RepID=UPI0015846F83|nr:VOC family protein [Streptomyces lunaelactis]NUK01669.1 VOC family protein [Streptomyces lunaelactis]NUK10399.1 VOC family protein [Streptomyces lunaelactis]NUK17876.1 VOC family protein [Streptomyces lunaelactis]NUK24839.1 VOC family protein [Streptomyces lunaelactis]NUK57268.1 VOC family protein [Streptomyces lunaelactis]